MSLASSVELGIDSKHIFYFIRPLHEPPFVPELRRIQPTLRKSL